jgi:exopolyphosphatase/guanosine-5'-triphosphate,3'-diphosphate pyrophosphatase
MEQKQMQVAAVIDIGSNSVRMVVAQIGAQGEITNLEQTRRAVRLGHDTFISGRLSQASMNVVISILRDYRQLLTEYAVNHVMAVATSAVREASNVDVFIDRVSHSTGFNIEVIEPSEESRLTVNAVCNAMPDAFAQTKGKQLIVEVGGGSAWLALLSEGRVVSSESYDLGSIRLQELLSTSQESVSHAADLLKHHTDSVLGTIKRSTSLNEVDQVIAVGGDMRFAAYRIGKPCGDPMKSSIIDLAEFDAFVSNCVNSTPTELVRQFGIAFSEAETLVPALLVYQRLARATRVSEIMISNVSMRDGLLFDLSERLVGHEDLRFADSAVHAAATIGEKYHYDARHAEQVAKLSLQLFDALLDEHGLGPKHRLLLHLAAILHDVGSFISARGHHKHSYYLISNSEIFGIRHEDMVLIGLISRYHRRSVPKSTHPEYTAIPRDHRIVINKLAAILRVADALDRSHLQNVTALHIQKKEDALALWVTGTGDLTAEHKALVQKADLFEDTFGLKVIFETAEISSGAPTPPQSNPSANGPSRTTSYAPAPPPDKAARDDLSKSQPS